MTSQIEVGATDLGTDVNSRVGYDGPPNPIKDGLPPEAFSDTSHGARGGGNLHAVATTTTNGFMSAADKVKLNGVDQTEPIAPSRFNDTSHGARGGGNLHAAATTSANGFMSAADKAKLDSIVEQSLAGWISGRDYTSGTLIQTSIPATAENGAAFLFEIVGNSYGSKVPFDIKVQGYLYGNTIINHGALSMGRTPSSIWLFQYAGYLCCWIPYLEYWQGYTVFATTVTGQATAKNMVTNIANSGKPASRSKEVQVPITEVVKPTGATFTGRVSVTSDTASAFEAITSGNDYGIRGRSLTAGYGGVLGWSADMNVYGILGYNNTYALYGAGQLYVSSDIRTGANVIADSYVWSKSGNFYGSGSYIVLGTNGSGGSAYLRPNGVSSSVGEMRVTSAGDVIVASNVYSGAGASFFATNGNLYGSAWGGYLSTYLDNRFAAQVYQGSAHDELNFPIGHVVFCGTINLARNAVLTPRLTTEGLGYSAAGTTGTSLAGTWRSRGRDPSNLMGILQRVA